MIQSPIPAIVITTPEMAVQDDLATLFAKNLTLAPASQQQLPAPEEEDPNKIVYISQHYNHSAHLAPAQQPRSSSEPDLAAVELLLQSHGVDTRALSLPQGELFRRADDAQKARLIELWTICPPVATRNPSLTWSATSVEQEELLARQRWEQAQQQQQPQEDQISSPEMVMSLDGTETETSLSNSPSSVQSSDGRWHGVAHAHTYMEPYMESGYEELARREYDANARKAALDPVYKATGGMLDWERQQWMENQYGSFVGGWRDDEEML